MPQVRPQRGLGIERRGRGRARLDDQGARRRGWVVTVAVVAGVLVSSLSAAVALSTPASAYPSSSVTIEGHGYGHGHGMGQWGALGYALAQTPYQSILGNYYGGTSLVGLTGPQEATTVRVDMTENDGNHVIVTSSDGLHRGWRECARRTGGTARHRRVGHGPCGRRHRARGFLTDRGPRSSRRHPIPRLRPTTPRRPSPCAWGVRRMSPCTAPSRPPTTPTAHPAR